MSVFEEHANLPFNADKVILGEKYKEILNKPLKDAGISSLFVPNNPFIDRRLSGHADLSVFHAGGEDMLLAPFLRGSEFAQFLANEGFTLEYADIKQDINYPYDAQLNAVMLKSRLIYCKKVTTIQLAEFVKRSREVELISVNQGYVNCSVCIVDENSIITSDRGIAEKCALRGMDVLLIRPGFFSLDGYDCGFIGGCTFKLSSDTLAFTGTIDLHPDKENIVGFLHEHSVRPIFLTEYPAFDIGGAIPIIEKMT